MTSTGITKLLCEVRHGQANGARTGRFPVIACQEKVSNATRMQHKYNHLLLLSSAQIMSLDRSDDEVKVFRTAVAVKVFEYSTNGLTRSKNTGHVFHIIAHGHK